MAQNQELMLSQEAIQAIIQGLANNETLATAIAERVRPSSHTGTATDQRQPLSTPANTSSTSGTGTLESSLTPANPTPQDPPTPLDPPTTGSGTTIEPTPSTHQEQPAGSQPEGELQRNTGRKWSYRRHLRASNHAFYFVSPPFTRG